MRHDNDFETTIDKKTLLVELRLQREALWEHLKDQTGPYKKAMAAHIKHVSSVLRKAADEIDAGTLTPEDGRWCGVRSIIERRIDDVPSGCADLEKKVRGYDAAISQIQHMPAGSLSITTSQIERWLGGGTVRGRRR